MNRAEANSEKDVVMLEISKITGSNEQLKQD